MTKEKLCEIRGLSCKALEAEMKKPDGDYSKAATNLAYHQAANYVEDLGKSEYVHMTSVQFTFFAECVRWELMKSRSFEALKPLTNKQMDNTFEEYKQAYNEYCQSICQRAPV